MSHLYEAIDRYLFDQCGNRIGTCEDDRAFVRVPSRAVRSIARDIWTVSTCTLATFLLPLVPVAVVTSSSSTNGLALALLVYLALLPLAAYYRFASEIISIRIPQRARGYYRATIGAFSLDLEIAILALLQWRFRLVQAYLLGKVVTTLLLTLGLCYIAAGCKREQTEYNDATASTSSGLLLFGTAMLMVLPCIEFFGSNSSPVSMDDGLWFLSHIIAVVLLATYVIYILHREVTHRGLFDPEYHGVEVYNTAEANNAGVIRNIRSGTACALLLGTTVVTYLLGRYLVGVFDDNNASHFSFDLEGLTAFTLLPLLSESVEFGSICSLAWHDRMSVAFEAAAGTGVQIIFLIAPLLHVLAWVLERPFNLSLQTFQPIMLFVAVWIFGIVVKDGRGHWFKGAMSLGL